MLAVALMAFAKGAHVSAGVGAHPLACGSVVTRELASGEEHVYQPLIGDSRGLVDVIDVSGTIGTLKLTLPGLDGGVIETCTGSARISGTGTIGVGDCIGDDSGTYAVAFNVVEPGPENCGLPLTCGSTHAGSLVVAGETDSFTFPTLEGQGVRVTVADPDQPARLLRLRLFDAGGGEAGESCGGTLDATIQRSGEYTILVSACDGTSVGPYALRWERAQGCGMPSPGDEFAYVFNAQGGTLAGIRTASHRVESLVPALALPDSEDQNTLRASADGAFVYVAAPNSPVIAAINTTTNRVAGSAVIPAIGASFALHPNGRRLFAPARVAAGVVVIDATTLKIGATIPVDGVTDADGIAVSPDGATLYVLPRGAMTCEPGPCPGTLAVVDPEGGTVTALIEDARLTELTEIRVSPSGQIAYVFRPNGPSIVVVDLQARAVHTEIGATARDVEFSADGSVAYATYGAQGEEAGVSIIDAGQHLVVDSIPLPDSRSPWGIGISSASGLVYVADAAAFPDQGQEDRPGLIVIDPVSRTVIGSANTFGGNPSDVVLVRAPEGLCAGDQAHESKVTVGELVTSVNYAIDGCPGEQLQEALSLPEDGDTEVEP